MIKRKSSMKIEEDFRPREIFGNTGKSPGDKSPSVLDLEPMSSRSPNKVLPKEKKRKVKSKTRKPSVLPGVEIATDAVLPDAVASVDPKLLLNVLQIPDHMLHSMKKRSDTRTMGYTDHVLSFIMPQLIALTAGTNYVRTAMQDGLGIEVEEDDSVSEVVQNLMRLDAITFFLKRSRLPLKYKREFLATLTQELAKSSASSLLKASSRSIQHRLKELEGIIISSRGYSKATDEKIQKTSTEYKKKSEAGDVVIHKQRSGILPAVKKPKRNPQQR